MVYNGLSKQKKIIEANTREWQPFWMKLSIIFQTVVLSVFLSGCVSTYDSQIQKLSQAYVAGEISKADYQAGFAAIQRKKAKQQEMLKALGEGLQAFGEGYQQAYNSAPNYNSQAYNDYVKNYSSTVILPDISGLYLHPSEGSIQNTSRHVDTTGREAYKQGFREGYRMIKGNLAVVPVIPVKPVTPVGSTDFREGIKAGMRAAQEGF